MLFMTILTWEPEKEEEVTKRRAEWNYPEGMEPKGEWVDLAGGRVFCLAEADDPRVILAATSPWYDLGKFEVTPVMEVEEMLKLMSEE